MKSGYRIAILIITLLLTIHYSMASSKKNEPAPLLSTCVNDSKIQTLRSKEIAQILASDQKDRERFFVNLPREEIARIMKNDLERRKRIGEIMAEGCLQTAADYSAASLIYQHGDVPTHFYLAYIWANQAIALGDKKQKNLAAMTLDRYLISTGKKQLFGTQYATEQAADACSCLEPVEHSFPDAIRMEYLGKKLADQLNVLSEINSKELNCPIAECQEKLAPTPKGTIIGFW